MAQPPRAAELFAAALRQHQAGRLAEAEPLYRQALVLDPRHADSLHGLGILAHQGGHNAIAADLIGKAVALDGSSPDFHTNHGAVLHALGKPAEAATAYRRAIALKPNHAAAHNNLGNALSEQGLTRDASAAYARAIALQPSYVEAHYTLGLAQQSQGDLEKAEASYRRAVTLRPDYAGAWNNLGNVLMRRGKADEAEAAYGRAVALQPGYLEALFNLAVAQQGRGDAPAAATSYKRVLGLKPDHADALNGLGLVLSHLSRLDEAAAAFARVIALRPGDAGACNNLGFVRREQGRLVEAEAAHRQALAISADDALAHHGLGRALQDQGRSADAEASLRRALALKPGDPEVHNDLGATLQHQGRPSEAVASYRQAITLKPDFAEAFNNLAGALHDQGEPDEAVAHYDRALSLKPDAGQAASNRLYCLAYGSGVSAEALADQHRAWGQRYGGVPRPSAYLNDRDHERRIRIGYVSGDFRAHSVAYFLEPLLRAHDRAAVELFAYAETSRPDRVTERLMGLCDHWRFTVGVTDEALAERIRADRIDILIDLAGHTAGSRLGVFARKPAPVQATWLGYPNTTGLDAIDYRIVDAVTDPPGVADALATEALVRLDGGFLCYAPLAEAPEVAPPPSLSGAPLTFGSFNNPAKLSDETVVIWAKLLERVPEARLKLKGNVLADPVARARCEARFAAAGLDPTRLLLQGWTPDLDSHLRAYEQVDIGLDPFPYNGTTTTCEAMWMGVPVVTLAGTRHSGRVGASLLTRVGLDALIAPDTDAYIEIAASLAADPTRLGTLRADLRPRMAASRLCDGPAFARSFEAALRGMWRRWCAGEAAGPLTPQ